MRFPTVGYLKENKHIFSNKKFFYTVILFCFITRILIAVRPIEYIDGLVILDDSYYSLTIAKNIAAGLGPFASDNHTNGFQPLYVFLMVPVYLFFPNDIVTPVHIALIMSALFEVVTLAIVLKILAMFSKTGWTFIAAGFLWISNAYIIKNTLGGLETALSVMFITLSLYYYFRLRQKAQVRDKDFLILGTIIGFAALSRIDNFFLLVSLLVVLVIDYYSYYDKKKYVLKNVLLISVGCLIIYVPWLVYSFLYTGDLFPVSGKALRFYSLTISERYEEYRNWYTIMFQSASETVYLYNKKLIVGSLLSFFVLLFLLKRNDFKISLQELFCSRCYILLIFGFLIFFSYAFYVFAHWYFPRYLYPLTLQFMFLLLFILDRVIYSGKKWAIIYSALIIAVITVINFKSSEFMNMYFLKDSTKFGFMNIGTWVRDNFPPGTTVGAGQSGAMEYFADNQKVINLDGVVNKAFYESCKLKKGIEYIKGKKIEYVVDWFCYIEFIEFVSANLKEGDLIYLETINSFQNVDSKWFVYRIKN